MLQSVSLQHYRNYTKKTIEFGPSLNIIIGENGKGKTNILESVYALSITKPFRSNKKEVFIQYNSDWSRIDGKTDEEEISIFWGQKNKFSHNSIPVTTREYMGKKKFLAVIFSPDDINLPFLPPLQRRKYLSQVLSPLFSEYLYASLQYSAVLKNRNQLLKKYADGNAKKDEFLFWDAELIKYNFILSNYHIDFCTYIQKKIQKEYKNISGKDEEVEMQYLQKVDHRESFSSNLEKNFQKDIFRGTTSAGVHRDDFILTLRGINISQGASRGEQRSVLLALKSMEKSYIKKITNTDPLILLDDVFSELDHSHQEHLVKSIKNNQCIITTTEINIDMKISQFRDVNIINV